MSEEGTVSAAATTTTTTEHSSSGGAEDPCLMSSPTPAAKDLVLQVPEGSLASHGVTSSSSTSSHAPQDGTLGESLQDEGEADPGAEPPASPLNIHSLPNRPFGDVVREILSGFQLRSTAPVAAEQLRYLVVHRDHDAEVLDCAPLLARLLAHVREAPVLPAAGSCMGVLAQLARTPGGCARLRAEGLVQPILRFMSVPAVLGKANAVPALLLLQNITVDRLCRGMVVKAGGVAMLVSLLGHDPAHLKQQPALAAHLTGSLLNLVAADGELAAAKQAFVSAGGMDVACRVLADWGRYDTSPAALRLRLLLADLGKLQQYSLKLHQTALDACTSARAACPTTSSRQLPPGSAGRGAVPGGGIAGEAAAATTCERPITPGSLGTPAAPDVIATAGKGIALGVRRMPASDRIIAAVLTHGKDLASDQAAVAPTAHPAPVAAGP